MNAANNALVCYQTLKAPDARFDGRFGSPLQYLQTRRLLTAKQLLTDTYMPTSHIAYTISFGGVRRFSI